MSLRQHQNLKASIAWHSALFIVQLSHLYMTTGKTIALTRQTIVRKAMSLSFNTLSRFVVVFLPRSNHLLIRSNMKQVLPHETTEKMGILNETTLLDAGCQVAQNSDP